MFERYTELARRAVFFARYEASQFGSPYIETEHLLLALLRENKILCSRLSPEAPEMIRAKISAAAPPNPKSSTSVDLPLSRACQRALEYAAVEADKLGQSAIDCEHLVLGVLYVGGPPADLLTDQGLSLDYYREFLRGSSLGTKSDTVAPENPEPDESEYREPASETLKPIVVALFNLVDITLPLFNAPPEYGNQKLKRKDWTRAEALGHLIDLATAHRLWIARALTEPRVTTVGYPPEEWVTMQHYRIYRWSELVDQWVDTNHFIIHVLTVFPEERTKIQIRIGLEEAIPLPKLLDRYVEKAKDLLAQITAHL